MWRGIVLLLFITLFSPKIQRLVTPLRLQRRRHLRSLKRRRLERQKEQKTEYECVSLFLCLSITCSLVSFRTLLSKRIAEKKEKVAHLKAVHKKYVDLPH